MTDRQRQLELVCECLNSTLEAVNNGRTGDVNSWTAQRIRSLCIAIAALAGLEGNAAQPQPKVYFTPPKRGR